MGGGGRKIIYTTDTWGEVKSNLKQKLKFRSPKSSVDNPLQCGWFMEERRDLGVCPICAVSLNQSGPGGSSG